MPTTTIAVTDPDPDGGLRTYAVAVSGLNPLYDLQTQLGLNQPVQTQNFDRRGQNERYLQSSNGSNPADFNYYVLMPTDKLYAYVKDAANDLVATLANLPVADFTTAPYAATGNVYNTPALLFNASPPAAPTVAANRGPLYDVQTQFGLTVPAKPALDNYRGQNEVYLQSANGSNAAGGYWYVLMPTDKLYAWDGVSIATTIANVPVADFTQPQYAAAGNVWADPSLLTAAQPAFIVDPIANVRQEYGLTKADPTQVFNYRGQNEKYLQSTNGSNAANGGWYVLMPTDKLYAYVKDATNDLTATLANPPVLDFTPYGNVYATSSLLYASTGQAAAVSASVSAAGAVTLTPNSAFVGTVRITVTVSDGAETGKQSYLFTVTDVAPTLTPATSSPVSVASTLGSTTIDFTTGINFGVTPQLSEHLDNPLFDLQAQLGLNQPDQYHNYRGQGEWYLRSSNGSNSAGAGWYVLMPTDKLYAYVADANNDLSATLAAPPVADFSQAPYAAYGNVFNTPSLLYDATSPPTFMTTSFPGFASMLLTWPSGYTGAFTLTIFLGDGAAETQQAWLVNITG